MLIDIQTASPPYVVPQPVATGELKKRMAVRPAVARLIDAASSNSGIDKRHFVVPDGDSSVAEKFFSKDDVYHSPDTKVRMMEYEKWSKLLTQEAVEKLLASTQFPVEKIDKLITISCTGFFAPGIDYHLINSLNIPLDIKRTNIGFMGCAAAVIGMSRVLDALAGSSENILLVSVEICSIHLQTEPTRDNILANMIFADGAAAALFSKTSFNGSKLKISFAASHLFKGSSEFMGWKIGNAGFEMVLSSELPKIIIEQAVPQLLKILDKEGIKKELIKKWALHPGGRAILDSLQKGLGLSDEEMIPSRKVLREYGNMSSASILFVMKEILNSGGVDKGDYCCAVAFGPGLTMEVALFQGV